MQDAVVLAFANTLTPSIATRSGQKLTELRMNEDLWWWYADGASGDSAVTEGKVQTRASDGGLREADGTSGDIRGKGKIAGGRGIPPPAK